MLHMLNSSRYPLCNQVEYSSNSTQSIEIFFYIDVASSDQTLSILT